MERATRIELAFSAWEADVLPLNYARGKLNLNSAPFTDLEGAPWRAFRPVSLASRRYSVVMLHEILIFDT